MTSYDHMTLLQLRLGPWADTSPTPTAATAARDEATERPLAPQTRRQKMAALPQAVKPFAAAFKKAVP